MIDAPTKKGRVGMATDSSVGGMLFGTQSRFEPGQELVLSFRVSLDQPEDAVVRGRVVWASIDESRDIFRRLFAVEFESELAGLEPFLCQA